MRLRRLSILACALALSGVHAQPTYATNFGSTGSTGTSGTTNGVWRTPDTTWVVSTISVGYWFSVAVESTGFADYHPTDLNFELWARSSCTSSDVCVYDDDYGDNGAWGWNACAGTTSGSHPSQSCTVQWVRLNTYYSPPEEHTTCHELGHTVGLRHGSETSSCMSISNTAWHLTSHDQAHINSTY